MNVGAGLAALFEGVERGLIPHDDVPDLKANGLGNLEAAVQAVAMLRSGQATEYPALRAVGDGPQALAERYPAMQDIVFTGGKGTLGNAGHCNALWTFLMPFSRFFGHYVGQYYKVEEELPPPGSSPEAYRACFERVVGRLLGREFFWLLANALSQCAFTFIIFSQDGEGGRFECTTMGTLQVPCWCASCATMASTPPAPTSNGSPRPSGRSRLTSSAGWAGGPPRQPIFRAGVRGAFVGAGAPGSKNSRR